MIHQNVTHAIMALKNGYHALPWYQKKFFFPKKLARKLEQSSFNAVDIENICYLNASAWFARFCFKTMREFYTSSVSKAYLSSVKKKQPILYRLGLGRKLGMALRNVFLESLDYPDPNGYVSNPAGHKMQNNQPPAIPAPPTAIPTPLNSPPVAVEQASQTSFQSEQFQSEQTEQKSEAQTLQTPQPLSVLKIPNIALTPEQQSLLWQPFWKDKPIWQARSFLEKKAELLQKSMQFNEFVQKELAGLSKQHATFVNHPRECDTLERELAEQNRKSKTAQKFSHNKRTTKTGMHVIPLLSPDGQWTHLPHPVQVPTTTAVYVADEAAREAAQLRSEEIVLLLQKKKADYQAMYQALHQAHLNYEGIATLQKKLTTLIENISTSNNIKHLTDYALLTYKEIVAAISPYLSRPNEFKKQVHMPVSQYANYQQIVTSFMCRFGIFCQLPATLKRSVANFVISSDFPEEDARNMFSQSKPK